MNYERFANQIAAAFVITMLQSGLIGSLVTQNKLGLYFSGSLLIFGSIFNTAEKYVLKNYFENVKIFNRPNPPIEGCSDFSSMAGDIPTFGMPSGHAQAVGFALAFWYKYMEANNDFMYKETFSYKLSLLCLIAIAIAICWSRISNGCHNLSQVVVGFIIGILFGIFSFKLYKKF